MTTQAPDTKWHYNLGFEEAREMALEIIEGMRDSGKFDIETLNAVETQLEEGN